MQFFDLSGKWQMTSPEMPGKNVPVSLPGDNYSALLDAGIIPDPYWNDNEWSVKKYSDYYWVMEREFKLDAAVLAAKRVFFEMDMADTLIRVFINGTKVLSGDNAFQFYRREVTKLLKKGKNTIRLEFDPVLPEAARRKARYRFPGHGAIFPTCPPAPDIQLIRKCLCHGGWDWGVQLLVSGVYGRIGLRCADEVIIDHLTTVQKFRGSSVQVTAVARVEAFRKCRREFTFEFAGEKRTVSVMLSRGVNEVKAVFEMASPKLWWPNGYGEQPLYDLKATCGECEKSVRIGIRNL
ncbi:MAG: hypothetical protein J6S21_03265, partial [Victivallales bacterium]|nr:hypothetical protein [Victivallales bacterium]